MLIAHCSLLIAHCSLGIGHRSLVIALLNAHCSLVVAHCSLLIGRCSLLIPHWPLLIAHCSLAIAPFVHCSSGSPFGPHRQKVMSVPDGPRPAALASGTGLQFVWASHTGEEVHPLLPPATSPTQRASFPSYPYPLHHPSYSLPLGVDPQQDPAAWYQTPLPSHGNWAFLPEPQGVCR